MGEGLGVYITQANDDVPGAVVQEDEREMERVDAKVNYTSVGYAGL